MSRPSDVSSARRRSEAAASLQAAEAHAAEAHAARVAQAASLLQAAEAQAAEAHAADDQAALSQAGLAAGCRLRETCGLKFASPEELVRYAYAEDGVGVRWVGHRQRLRRVELADAELSRRC